MKILRKYLVFENTKGKTSENTRGNIHPGGGKIKTMKKDNAKKSRISDKITCVLCSHTWVPANKYDIGNNAQPVADGRACDTCDWQHVIPARIKNIKSEKT